MSVRLRQAVIAAWDLEAVAEQLRAELGVGEPYSDPGVGHFGLRNAVFALRDGFLEVVSPIGPDASVARLLERRGGDTGYMLMFQVDGLEAPRARARQAGVREVFEVSLDEMAEVHLHPADMRGALVSLSEPRPRESWLWGGPGWDRRSAGLRLAGATVAVSDPGVVAERWGAVLGVDPAEAGIRISADDRERGLTEIILRPDVPEPREPLAIGGVQFVFESEEALS